MALGRPGGGDADWGWSCQAGGRAWHPEPGSAWASRRQCAFNYGWDVTLGLVFLSGQAALKAQLTWMAPGCLALLPGHCLGAQMHSGGEHSLSALQPQSTYGLRSSVKTAGDSTDGHPVNM